MKLVVLDGYALNPGDLSWEPLQAIANCQIFDRTAERHIVAHAADAEIVLTNKVPLRSATLAALSALRYIGVLATGFDIIDLEQADRQNVVVTNVPAYSTNSVAQLVFALVLEICNHVGLHNAAVQSGEWSRSPDFCFRKTPLVELHGKTMGIVGHGRIGKQVSDIARAFGMRVIVTTSRRPENLPADIEWDSVENVFAESDVISLHCPLRPETRGLVNSARIATMKPSAILINTSRGGLIVERDLADALNSGRLAGAGLDVLSVEPPTAGNPLIGAKNCILSPHIAWATKESRTRCLAIATDNVKNWLAGHPENVVNRPRVAG